MNRQNALVCSYETLSKITGFSRATLSRAIKLLETEHWLQIIKLGTANAYVINSKVFWQSYGDKKMTVFHATIVASEDEQQISPEKWAGITLKNYPLLK
jgi:DNA-binding transcriptional MocR family regulator